MVVTKKLNNLIKNLNSLNKSQLKYVISIVDEHTLELFREIFLNLNYNTLKINNDKSKKLFEKMHKNKAICEAIANNEIPVKKRRQYLKSQAGSGLITLALSVLAPVIAGLISDATSKKECLFYSI